MKLVTIQITDYVFLAYLPPTINLHEIFPIKTDKDIW